VVLGVPLRSPSLGGLAAMVKADLTRDYYADLELQAGATEAEIKKQFKKLGTVDSWLYNPCGNLLTKLDP
jgi:hypothetical protein